MITISTFATRDKVPAALEANAKMTISIVNEIISAIPGTQFTSGYRSAAHNKSVGGVPTSYHVKALAADIVPPGGQFQKYKAQISAIVEKYGYELIDESTKKGAAHFHIEPAKKKKMIPVTPSEPVTVVNDPSVRLTDNQQTAGKSAMILTVVGMIAFIVWTETRT